ncbi:MAG: winged helix-turn-helix domain-containing protein [Thermoplasmatales archaeon]|nr:winged helix-turn-helix domain-containing protein [Thermoplasmatales archaeon]
MRQESMYEGVEKSLKFLTTSSVRNKILMSLREGVKDLSDLKDEMKLESSTIIHSVRAMEGEDLLVEKEDGYHLTQIGKILSHKLFDMVKTLNALNNNREFWLSHQIDGIPQQFLERIGEVGDSEIVRASIRDIWKVYSTYFELIRKAKEFRGVSPVFHPRFPGAVEKLASKNVDTYLVMTNEVLESVLEALDEKHRERLRDTLHKDNFGLWITDDDIKVAFTVTDSIISLSLFSNDGAFDPTQDLISHNKEAINWGRELFEYYRKKAKRVKPEDI